MEKKIYYKVIYFLFFPVPFNVSSIYELDGVRSLVLSTQQHTQHAANYTRIENQLFLDSCIHI